jgi:hypothetical protein
VNVRRVAALAAAATPLSLTPATAVEVSLKSPFCAALPGAGLHLSLDVAPTTTDFSATAKALLCNATSVATAIEMQVAGAGVNAKPVGGGPIAGAPFAVDRDNDVSVTATMAVRSDVNQTVVVNVAAQAVTVGAQFAVACQAVVELISGAPYVVKGC